MLYPTDNSTDPPFRYITKAEIEDAFGEMSKMMPGDARDVLYALCATHWLSSTESEAVQKELAIRAGILDDLDELTNLGLEELFVKTQIRDV
jgi:hypothetical protein